MEVHNLFVPLQDIHFTTSIKKENKKKKKNNQRALLNGKENCWFSYDCFLLKAQETGSQDLIKQRFIFSHN